MNVMCFIVNSNTLDSNQNMAFIKYKKFIFDLMNLCPYKINFQTQIFLN